MRYLSYLYELRIGMFVYVSFAISNFKVERDSFIQHNIDYCKNIFENKINFHSRNNTLSRKGEVFQLQYNRYGNHMIFIEIL